MVSKADLVGVYRQIGEETVDASGRLVQSDRNRSSQIMYSPDGYIGVLSTPNGRKTIPAASGRTDLGGAKPEELVDATRTVTSYAGHYDVKDGEVHHHVEMALNPELVGQTMIRRIEIDGPNLTLSTRPDAQGQVKRILWRRVEAM